MSDSVKIARQVPDHARGLFDALTDPRIYEFLDGGPPKDAQSITKRITRQAKGPIDGHEVWLNWSIFQAGHIVGLTQATITPDGQADIAYVLSPKAWGHGVAETATRLMIDELIRDHGVTRLVADTDQANAPSQRLLARLGFKQTHCHGDDVFFARAADA